MILLRNALIYDNRSKHHLKQFDLLVDKGVIVKIGKRISSPSKAKVISSDQLSISPGWLDIGTYNGEPGFEYREDLNSLSQAAAHGGYCRLAPFPTCSPTLDNIGQLLFLKALSSDLLVDILPIATLTQNRAGKELAELMDLHHSGACAFSDGELDHLSSPQLLRSMLYLKSMDATTIYSPCKMIETSIHEGPVSVQMGLPGSSSQEEESNIDRAIRQSEYADARLLLYNISTTASLRYLKSSSNKDRISTSVSFMNLIKEDTDVLDFALNLKVSPPLRNASERKALIKAVTSGQINIITSNHRPLSIEEKDQPFGLSKIGASTIDTVFQALNTYANNLQLERLVHCLSIGPHEALGIDCPKVEVGQSAMITCFDPTPEVNIEEQHIYSKSKNNPFIGESLRGRVIGVINGKKSVFHAS